MNISIIKSEDKKSSNEEFNGSVANPTKATSVKPPKK